MSERARLQGESSAQQRNPDAAPPREAADRSGTTAVAAAAAAAAGEGTLDRRLELMRRLAAFRRIDQATAIFVLALALFELASPTKQPAAYQCLRLALHAGALVLAYVLPLQAWRAARCAAMKLLECAASACAACTRCAAQHGQPGRA